MNVCNKINKIIDFFNELNKLSKENTINITYNDGKTAKFSQTKKVDKLDSKSIKTLNNMYSNVRVSMHEGFHKDDVRLFIYINGEELVTGKNHPFTIQLIDGKLKLITCSFNDYALKPPQVKEVVEEVCEREYKERGYKHEENFLINYIKSLETHVGGINNKTLKKVLEERKLKFEKNIIDSSKYGPKFMEKSVDAVKNNFLELKIIDKNFTEYLKKIKSSPISVEYLKTIHETAHNKFISYMLENEKMDDLKNKFEALLQTYNSLQLLSTNYKTASKLFDKYKFFNLDQELKEIFYIEFEYGIDKYKSKENQEYLINTKNSTVSMLNIFKKITYLYIIIKKFGLYEKDVYIEPGNSLTTTYNNIKKFIKNNYEKYINTIYDHKRLKKYILYKTEKINVLEEKINPIEHIFGTVDTAEDEKDLGEVLQYYEVYKILRNHLLSLDNNNTLNSYISHFTGAAKKVHIDEVEEKQDQLNFLYSTMTNEFQYIDYIEMFIELYDYVDKFYKTKNNKFGARKRSLVLGALRKRSYRDQRVQRDKRDNKRDNKRENDIKK